MARWRLWLDPCWSGWIVAAAWGCGEYGARIYSAHPYRVARDCLEASVAIGVVQAEELPSTCDPRCLLLDETLYVSSVCPPVPARARVIAPEDSAECANALDLLAAKRWCETPADASSADAASSQEAAAP